MSRDSIAAEPPGRPGLLDEDAWTRGFASGALTPVDHLEDTLARLAASEPTCGAFARVRPEARAEAEASAARWRTGRPRSPVDGLTFTVKDSFDVEGCPKRFGSQGTSEAPGTRDAAVVARLRRAGGVLLGVTTMSELGVEASSRNPLHGVTRNPLHPAWSAGGSSGGAAASVAAGAGSMALATDAGGSVRIPAAFTGTFGLKLGPGAIPDAPGSVMGACSAVGLITRTPAALARWWRVLGKAEAPAHPEPPRFRATDTWGAARPDAVVEAALLRAIERIGGACTRVPPPDPAPDADAAFRVLLRRGARASVEALPPGGRARVGAEVARLVALAERDTDDDARAAERVGVEVARVLEAWTADGALLLLPVARVLPFAAEDAGPPGAGDFVSWGGFAHLANLAGVPALSVPTGRAEDGRPTALQVVGPVGAEGRLVAAAAWLAERLAFPDSRH